MRELNTTSANERLREWVPPNRPDPAPPKEHWLSCQQGIIEPPRKRSVLTRISMFRRYMHPWAPQSWPRDNPLVHRRWARMGAPMPRTERHHEHVHNSTMIAAKTEFKRPCRIQRSPWPGDRPVGSDISQNAMAISGGRSPPPQSGVRRGHHLFRSEVLEKRERHRGPRRIVRFRRRIQRATEPW